MVLQAAGIQPTTDDIEMRACKKEDGENIGITEVEIYVQ